MDHNGSVDLDDALSVAEQSEKDGALSQARRDFDDDVRPREEGIYEENILASDTRVDTTHGDEDTGLAGDNIRSSPLGDSSSVEMDAKNQSEDEEYDNASHFGTNSGGFNDGSEADSFDPYDTPGDEPPRNLDAAEPHLEGDALSSPEVIEIIDSEDDVPETAQSTSGALQSDELEGDESPAVSEIVAATPTSTHAADNITTSGEVPNSEEDDSSGSHIRTPVEQQIEHEVSDGSSASNFGTSAREDVQVPSEGVREADDSVEVSIPESRQAEARDTEVEDENKVGGSAEISESHPTETPDANVVTANAVKIGDGDSYELSHTIETAQEAPIDPEYSVETPAPEIQSRVSQPQLTPGGDHMDVDVQPLTTLSSDESSAANDKEIVAASAGDTITSKNASVEATLEGGDDVAASILNAAEFVR
ncbi:hypothetical protein HK405_014079 [Cladochytrium tenue]|nr:hypothetical protein HK405_014079 [Cladochytrium tenue]